MRTETYRVVDQKATRLLMLPDSVRREREGETWISSVYYLTCWRWLASGIDILAREPRYGDIPTYGEATASNMAFVGVEADFLIWATAQFSRDNPDWILVKSVLHKQR